MSVSEFYKYDLHIHTDASNLTKSNDYKGLFNLRNLLEKLDENNVAVFSLTDHNIFNIEVYKELERIPEERYYFIGLELDIVKEEELLFSIKQSLSDQKINKYHSVIIFKSKNIEGLNNKLNEMYKKIDADYISKYDDECNISEKNLLHRKTSLDRFIDSFLGENYLITAHGRKDSDIVDAYKGQITTAQNMILLGFINSLEMSPNKINAKEHFNKGFDKLQEDEYKGRDDIPYVVFSDNHQIDAYPNYKKDQIIEDRPFTWVKGDCSFETLKLAFVDPSSRIKVQREMPLKPSKYLEKLSFDVIQNGIKDRKEIIFSSGLNTIVGGRSSGKSLLFNAILNNINTSRSESKIDDYCATSNEVIDKESINGKMNFETDEKKSNICNTIAYTQEQIVDLFNGTGKKLGDELPFLHYSKEDIQNGIQVSINLLDKFVQKYKEYYSVLRNRESVFLVEDIINSKKKKEIEYPYEHTLNILKNKKADSSKSISEKQEKFILLKKELAEILTFQVNQTDIFSLEEIETMKIVIDILKKKGRNLEEFGKRSLLNEKLIAELEVRIPTYLDKINSQNDRIITEAKIRYNNNIQTIKSYFIAKMNLKKICDELNQLDIKFTPLSYKPSEQYILTTSINYKFNIAIFIEKILEKITNNNNSDLFGLMIDLSEGKVNIKRKSNKPEDLEWAITQIENEMKRDIEPSYSIVEQGKIRNLSSEHMSPGKKASTFLEIKLEIGSLDVDPTIYLIDQPEDNLDNLFITDTLISKLRRLREKSQVIIVTHNAAIAINSDSENIIIASNDDEAGITYNSSGLEDVEFRKEVCKLLDGGFYVFDRRYHKYDIPFKRLYEPITKEEGE